MTQTVKGKNQHAFGRQRPSYGGRYPLHVTPERDTHFRDLPPPTGEAPFRLDLKDVISESDYATIKNRGKLTFHLNGDMGGILYAVPQELVAKGMEADHDDNAD